VEKHTRADHLNAPGWQLVPGAFAFSNLGFDCGAFRTHAPALSERFQPALTGLKEQQPPKTAECDYPFRWQLTADGSE